MPANPANLLKQATGLAKNVSNHLLKVAKDASEARKISRF
jgi:hypothetical protein